MPQFLHVGCGSKHKDRTTPGFNRPEWNEVRLDVDPAVAPHITASMLDMSALESGSMDALFSSHNIEHLYPHEVPQALAEFKRVLKPEGWAVITCPDLQSVAELIAHDKLEEAAYVSPAGPIAPLDILYGHRTSLARGNLYMAHRTGFTLKTLIGALQNAGFSSVAGMRRKGPEFDLWIVASPTNCGQDKLERMAGEHFPRSSKAVPAAAN